MAATDSASSWGPHPAAHGPPTAHAPKPTRVMVMSVRPSGTVDSEVVVIGRYGGRSGARTTTAPWLEGLVHRADGSTARTGRAGTLGHDDNAWPGAVRHLHPSLLLDLATCAQIQPRRRSRGVPQRRARGSERRG